MRYTMVIISLFMLSGCSSMKKTFENRVACTADGTQLVVVSMYGPIGVASKIAPEDAAVICAKKV